MKRVNARSIGELIREYCAENPLMSKHLNEVRIINAWREVLGPGVTKETRSIFVHEGTLHVVLNSAVLRSELMMWRDRLVRSLNEKAGADVIHEIRFR